MADYERGVAQGSLECEVLSTSKTNISEFAIEFKVFNEQITRYVFSKIPMAWHLPRSERHVRQTPYFRDRTSRCNHYDLSYFSVA